MDKLAKEFRALAKDIKDVFEKYGIEYQRG